MESWPRILQGLCNIYDPEPSPPDVHRDHWDVCNSLHRHALRASTPTTSTIVWGLDLTLSSSTVLDHSRFSGSDLPALCLGMDMVCVGRGGRGAYSGACNLTEALPRHSPGTRFWSWLTSIVSGTSLSSSAPLKLRLCSYEHGRITPLGA